MEKHLHFGIDQVENGWLVTVIQSAPFGQQPTQRVLIAPTIGDACTMIVAEVGENREVRRDDVQGRPNRWPQQG